MAGAVSAGAYTAGVIDYLLEALDLWEQAKAKNRALSPEDPAYDHSIPMHDVVIEVLGGASAGAMTAAIMTMALSKGISPIRILPQGDEPTGNLLYDAWVGLNDNDEQLTLQQMFGTDDLKDGQPLRSILNSLPVRRIGERAMQAAEPGDTWPAYVSRNLQVMLTLSNLRGIPISMAFEPSHPRNLEQLQATLAQAQTVDEINQGFAEHPGAYHTMHVHKTTAHFSIQPPDQQKKTETPAYVMPIDLTDPNDRRKMVDHAIASGAFPIALSPVDFASQGSSSSAAQQPAYAPPRSYFLAQLRRMFPHPANRLLSQVEQSYHYTAVDGGTLNNEPFGEVMDLLRQKGGHQDNYALLVIDPFPSTQKIEAYDFPDSMAGVASQLIGALRQQAMVKEQEIRQGFEDDYTVAMIMPSRQELVDGNPRPAAYPIACGSLEGFGGFFHRPFREHDFFLGRKNCQSFLRQHFTASHHQLQRAGVLSAYLGAKPTRARSMAASEIDRGGELYRRFAVEKPQGASAVKARGGVSAENATEERFPIIPDLSIDPKVGARAIRMEAEDAIPSYEAVRIDKQKLWSYAPDLTQRIRGILDHYLRWPIPGLGMTLRTLSVISLVIWLMMWLLLLGLEMPSLLVGIVSLLMSLLATPLLVVWIVRPILIRLVARQVFKLIEKQLKKHGLLAP